MNQLFQGPQRLKLLESSSHLDLCHPELFWLYLSRPQKGPTNGRNIEEGILFQGDPERVTGRFSTTWPFSDIPQFEIQHLTLTLNLGHQCDLHVTLTRLQRLLFPSPWGSASTSLSHCYTVSGQLPLPIPALWRFFRTSTRLSWFLSTEGMELPSNLIITQEDPEL